MHESAFDREEAATLALAKLMSDAREVRAKYEAAGLAIPGALSRLFGDAGARNGASRGRVTIPPMEQPPRPQNAQHDWIWIKFEELSVQTIALTVLGASGKPMTPKEVLDEARKLGLKTNSGSLYNVFPRLESAAVAVRSDEGWRLADGVKVPLIHGGFAWGPPDVFPKNELAAHRRDVICHLLRVSTDGLMQMQILRQLQDSGMCKGPMSKDLVKMDINTLLAEGRIRRAGHKKFTTKEQRIQA